MPDTKEEVTEDPAATSEETKPEDTETPPSDAGEETAPEGDKTREEGKAEEEVTEEESEDLDDDTIGALVDAYGDRFVETPKVKKQIAKAVADQVRSQVQEHERARTIVGEADSVVAQGRDAAENIANTLSAIQGALARAEAGEELPDTGPNPYKNVFDTQKFGNSIKAYAAAVGQNNARIYESAIEEGFRPIFGDVLPELSAEQADTLNTIVNNANRMEQDPAQKASSRTYLLGGLFRFVAEHAVEHGATEEQHKVETRKGLKDKVSSANAIAAAKAKLEKEKVPPVAPASAPDSKSVGSSIKDYEEAKEEGRRTGDWSRVEEIDRRVLERSLSIE